MKLSLHLVNTHMIQCSLKRLVKKVHDWICQPRSSFLFNFVMRSRWQSHISPFSQIWVLTKTMKGKKKKHSYVIFGYPTWTMCSNVAILLDIFWKNSILINFKKTCWAPKKKKRLVSHNDPCGGIWLILSINFCYYFNFYEWGWGNNLHTILDMVNMGRGGVRGCEWVCS